MDSHTGENNNTGSGDDNPFAKTIKMARQAFDAGITSSLAFRREQLKNFRRMMLENDEQILNALHQDLRKPAMECKLGDMKTVIVEIEGMLSHLKEYTSNEKLPFNILTPTDKGYVRKEPFGVVLILGTWNYPFQTVCQPLAGAIAAGNCAVLKVSEVTPASAKVMAELIPKYLNKQCYHVVQGDVEASKLLLKNKFDYIFCTGSHAVGRSILQAAAPYLTPVTLELGGKNPCYIDTSADYKAAARKIFWGKQMNGGQICVAPGYVICPEEAKDVFIQTAKKYLKKCYANDAQKSPDIVRIVNKHHFNRLKKLLEATKGTIALGGKMDEDDLWIEPTIVVDVNPDTDALMQEEIFGPILPIVTISSVNDALRIIRSKPKPLAMYIFSSNKYITQKVIESTSSGQICINDVFWQSNRPGLAFGGVGDSGMGRYHGKSTFDTFCHRRTILEIGQNFLNEKMYDIRYPPYNNTKQQILSTIAGNFELFYIPFGGKISHLLALLVGVAVTLLALPAFFDCV